jgi:hypothetical protein
MGHRNHVKKGPGHGNNYMEKLHGKEVIHGRFVDKYIECKNVKKAVLEAYGDTLKYPVVKGANLLKRADVQAIIKERLQKLNATPERVAEVVSDAFEATKIAGKLEQEVPDHRTRMQAANFVMKVYDAFPKAKVISGNGEGSKHLHVYLQEPAAVRKFIIENNRMPEPEERKLLLGEADV